MKKYHLFSGANYYPSIGLGDYIGSFDDAKQAHARGKALLADGRSHCQWYYIAYTKEDGSLGSFFDPDYEEPHVD